MPAADVGIAPELVSCASAPENASVSNDIKQKRDTSFRKRAFIGFSRALD